MHMSASSSNTMNGLEELCEQYYIAGWLTTPQYEYYRHELQQNRVRTGGTTTASSTNKLEIWKQQIQQSIKANAQMKQQQQHDESTQRSNKTSTKYTSSSSVTSSESHGLMIYTPTEFQTHVILPSSSHNYNNNNNINNNNSNNNKNINIKELFVEMCFYARLGYIQPPRCLHCTYTECYTGNTTVASSSTTTLCHRYVIWRKDTNLVLDPDTIASNILILPCYLVQQLLNHSDDDDDQQQQGHRRLLPPPNGNIPMRRSIESTNYLYDPFHTTIVRK